MSILRTIDNIFFGKARIRYETLLRNEIVNTCNNLLDVGCGTDSPIRTFSHDLQYTLGIDGFAPSIEQSQKNGIHHDYRLLDILSISEHFLPQSFDCVIACDVIEHLSKSDGFTLLDAMEKIAKKKVIVFTPNGFLPQEPYDGNEYQRHLSGWDIEEMQERGYRVLGVGGWKPLRGEMSLPTIKPNAVGARISFLSQPLVENNPKYAFQILCIKDIK